jgi:hypothetical protein
MVSFRRRRSLGETTTSLLYDKERCVADIWFLHLSLSLLLLSLARYSGSWLTVVGIGLLIDGRRQHWDFGYFLGHEIERLMHTEREGCFI